MINFKSESEKKILFYYAEKLNDEVCMSILRSGVVKNSDEATSLSHFFWNAVDASISDQKEKNIVPWSESSEYLSERVMYSISGYLERAGFENEWESVSEAQDER